MNLKVHCPHCGADFELTDDEAATPLRLARLEKGVSIPIAADEVGMSSWALSRLERGAGNPKLSILKKISSYYGKSIEDLFPEPLVDDIEAEPLPEPDPRLDPASYTLDSVSVGDNE